MNRLRRPVLLIALAAFVSIGQLSSALQQPEPTPTSGRPKLTQQEKSRTKQEGKEVVTYVLKAEGLPVDQRYQVGGRWMNGKTAEISRGVRVDESGRVLGPGGDEVELALAQMQPGEFMMVALVSEDRASTAAVLITPFPIQSQGKGGCRLSAETLTPKGEAFLIRGSGFRPNEDIATVSTSVDETARTVIKGRPDGTVKAAIFPTVVGKTGGDATYMASDSACSAIVKYKWGDAMIAAAAKPAPAPPPTPAPTPTSNP